MVALTSPLARRAIAASRAATVLVAAAGIAVLMGWFLDVPGLRSRICLRRQRPVRRGPGHRHSPRHVGGAADHCDCLQGRRGWPLARRLLPVAVLVPFGVGWLLARRLGSGLVDGPFAVSAMALVLIVTLAVVIWRTGSHLVLPLDARAATERALADSERTLRHADQQKAEPIATLSHELRNPLAPIRFAVELLHGPPASAQRARETIARQVRHLTRLVDDLLDLTRITRNKLELHVRPSELRQLVSDATDAVANELSRAGHELHVELPPQPVWLQADPDRVVQMLVNLLTNATRYSEPGGKVWVGASVDNLDVTLWVRDAGQGIDPADLKRVFDRFVQVGKERHGGLGIGLALVKALAELHGGEVEARSDGVGRGAEFRVKLPRAASQPLVDSRVAPPPSASRRVLVVDDNRDAAEMLGRVLTTAGHRVIVSYAGEDALRRARQFKPEVGLLDIGMPGMDGYELAALPGARFPGEPGAPRENASSP